jgi:probable HAF family extracellular repeat protein
MKRCLIALRFAWIVSLCGATDVAAQKHYALTRLDQPTNEFVVQAVSEINSYGQIVGNTYRESSGDRGFLWTPNAPNGTAGAVRDLGLLRQGFVPRAGADGINSSGQIAGFSTDISPADLAVLWTPTIPNGTSVRIVRLGDLPGSNDYPSYAYGINDVGQVVGEARTANGPTHAFLWTPSTANGMTGSMQDLGTLTGNTGGYSQALGINSIGQVVGVSSSGIVPFRPFLWNPLTPNGTTGAMFPLGVLPGTANEINDYGQVIGESNAVTGTRAFLWTPTIRNGVTGTMVDLGDFAGGRNESRALGMNSAGHVVGESWVTEGPQAFLWMPDAPNASSGTMRNLNSLLSASDRSQWQLHRARDINDLGQIIGSGLFDPDGAGPMIPVSRAFLLTPVPEPCTTWIATGLGFAFCIAPANRSRSGHGASGARASTFCIGPSRPSWLN